MSMIDSMPSREFVFGSILLLSNKLQIVGDDIMEGLTLKQWFLLIMMKMLGTDTGTTALSVTDIAGFTGTSRQNVKKMLDVLARKDFVIIKDSLTDHRALDVSLTEKCHEFFRQTDQFGDYFLDLLYEDVSPSDLDIVAKVFRQLFVRIESMPSIISRSFPQEDKP